MNKKIIFLLLFFIIALSFVFFFFNRKEKEDTELIPVSLELKWLHQSQFAGNYTAKERGFYADEGLNVTLIPFSFENPVIKSVTEGSAMFGITGADELLIARTQGAPLKALAVIYKINPVCAYTLKKSGITKPQDFIGKTIGIERASDGTEVNIGILYSAMMSKLGIDRSKIKEITIGYDPSELLSGKTDVSTGYIINEPHRAVMQGHEINTILMADYGVNMYADVLFASESTINQKPELVEKMLRATLKGWQYAIENNDEAISDVLKYSKNAASHEIYMLKSSIPLINTGDTPLGWMEKTKWEQVQNILFEQKILNTIINIEDIYTIEPLKKIYNR
ncbi:MAG: NMT1/THI5 like domain-containing protein [Parcubacteria group bacterium LiPW_41]|nr:MAG: NMT1/THI5 like domain-containing protein [Parcubacteria group bacterium LiPW_41]